MRIVGSAGLWRRHVELFPRIVFLHRIRYHDAGDSLDRRADFLRVLNTNRWQWLDLRQSAAVRMRLWPSHRSGMETAPVQSRQIRALL